MEDVDLDPPVGQLLLEFLPRWSGLIAILLTEIELRSLRHARPRGYLKRTAELHRPETLAIVGKIIAPLINNLRSRRKRRAHLDLLADLYATPAREAILSAQLNCIGQRPWP